MKHSPLLLFVAVSLAAQPRPDHVVVIGLDGFGAEALRQGEMPNLRKLVAAGAWTLHARGVMPTVSSPNWASMIMGAGPEQHGVLDNKWEPGPSAIAPTCRGMAATFPTIFGLLRQHSPQLRIAVIHDWNGFGRLIEADAANLVRHVKGSPAATDAAIEYFRQNRPHLLFLHLDDVDHAGHDHGWHGAEYKRAVEMVDGLIGRMVEATVQAGVRERTAFLVTADHGGRGKEHGGNTMAELEIPWILQGPGIAAREIAAAVNTYDTAATIAALFGVTPPACWIGKPVTSAWR